MFAVILAAVLPAFAGLLYHVDRQRESLRELAEQTALRYVDAAGRREAGLLDSTRQTLSAIAMMPMIAGAKWPMCQGYFAELLARGDSPYNNLGVIAPDGEVLCSGATGPGGRRPPLGDRPWFARALREDGFVISGFQVGRASGRPGIVVATAVRDGEGRPRGVLYASLRLPALVGPGTAPPRDGVEQLAVLDRAGRVLSASTTELGEPGEPILDERIPALAGAGTDRRGTTQLAGPDGRPWLVAYARAGLAGDADALTVVYRSPVSELLADGQRSLWTGVLGTLLLALLALAAAWTGAHTIVVRNLRAMTEAATRLRLRQFDTRVGGRVTGQEFGEIAAQFDQMAQELDTREKQWQALLQRQRRQNQILRRIAHDERLERSLEALAHFAEEQSNGAVACIMLATPDGSRIASCIAPGLPSSWREAVTGLPAGLQAGTCGLAIAEKHIVVTPDIRNDPRWQGGQNLATGHGLRACWSHPVVSSGGRILGALGLYYRTAGAPRTEDQQMGQMAAELAAVAVERDRISAALAQSEAEYRLLFERNPNPMWVREAGSGRILAVNDQAIAHYGYAREEFLALCEADLDSCPGPAREAGAGAPDGPGRPAGPVLRSHRRKDGGLIAVEASHLPLSFAGRPAVLAIMQDVTERTVLTQNLRERDELFTLLMESTVEAICGVDLEGRCTFANQACATLLGYETAELLGRPIHALIHHHREDGTPYPEQDCPIHQAAREHRTAHVDGEVFWRKDGTALPVEYWAYPMMREGARIGTIITFLDVTERRRASQALRHQATHDAHTGLYNRASFAERVRALLQAPQAPGPFAILLLDLDGFKEVNDTLGHHMGDVLLQEVAQRMRESLPDDAMLARIGGDEFAMLIERCGAERAGQAVRALLERIRTPYLLNAMEIQIGASVGIVLYPEGGTDLNSLMRHADFAMYEAKRAGTGHSFWDARRDDQAPSRLLLTNQLRQALEAGELELHYQPQVSLRDAGLAGFEALVRWRHPERGLIFPSEFMPLVEVSDLIHPFTLWVIEEAVRQCSAWRADGHAGGVAVNVSTRNLLDLGLPAKVRGILARHGLPPACLELEITESSIMADPARSLQVLMLIHEIGVRIAIDDFGTGYSSLAYLQKLPVENLKIDKSFIAEMAAQAEARTIVSSIVGLAHSLGVQVTAEGIEDQAAMGLLTALGCDYAQGYHIARPMDAQRAGTWLHAYPGPQRDARAAARPVQA